MVNKDEWYTKEGHSKSTKNALYVQRYGKRHPLGWNDVEQQKNQVCSFSQFWVWRQAGKAGRQARQAGRQALSIA